MLAHDVGVDALGMKAKVLGEVETKTSCVKGSAGTKNASPG